MIPFERNKKKYTTLIMLDTLIEALTAFDRQS